MSRSLSYLAALAFAVPVVTGCTAQSTSPTRVAPTPTTVAEDVKAVELPKELLGKWRHESTDEKTKAKKTLVYHFRKDGPLEVEAVLTSPNVNTTDLVKRAITKLDGDKLSVMDISRVAADGVETPFPEDRQRKRTYRFQVKGDELTLSEVDEKGKPTPMVLKRVKDEKK